MASGAVTADFDGVELAVKGADGAWTAVPIATVTVLFVMGFRGFLDLDTPPSDADVLDVEARQWGEGPRVRKRDKGMEKW